ncbi:MAG: ComF family protein [Acidobacteria bacterium]|nr:ComF family protein [Acidobacteriota bacterium]
MPVCERCLAAPVPLEAEYFCVSCRTPFLNRYPLDAQGRCGLCRAGVRGFASAYCFGEYEGVLRELIHLFKYRGMKPLARPLAGFLWRALPLDEVFDAVVPMPLHWRRRWSRGFNQAGLLARELARRRGLPMIAAVRRVRHTQTQTGLTHAQRRENVAGAFRLRKRARIEGKRLLLVDDVMTTGATGSACAAVLRRGGARSVTLLTLARVDRRAGLPAAPPLVMGALA